MTTKKAILAASLATLAMASVGVTAMAQNAAPAAAGATAGAPAAGGRGGRGAAAAPAAAPGAFDPNATGGPGGGGGRAAATGPNCGGTYRSVEQSSDSHLTFRFCAANTNTVTVSGDLPERVTLTRGTTNTDLFTGTTTRPVPAGSYRYAFSVDGITTVDPQATEVAGSTTGFKGVLSVTGPAGDFQAFNPAIPHGVVHQVYYQSKSLGGVFRRMQIYTPPGYEGSNNKKYPVLYIRHGAGDDDTDWMTVGRAPYILDNLIAAGKALPMIVVSGADPGNIPLAPGATRPAFTAGTANGVGAPVAGDRYGVDLFGDIIPYVESHYRAYTDADHRAMAGLSAGGATTVNNGLPNPQTFHYIGIFSISGGGAAYETRVGAALTKGAKDFKLVYYACGNADPLIRDHGDALLATLDKYNIKYIKNITGGGHTWTNWRDYLNAFVPLLFKGKVNPQQILS